MTASAYHLFCDLYQRRRSLRSEALDAEQFMLRDDLVAGRSGGRFPDLVLRTNPDDPLFAGGELIEVKDSKSYSIPSFNSTVPSAVKNIRAHITLGGSLYKQIEENDGRDPYEMENREVYYLIRGRKNKNCKVCLVHGAFFETVDARENIRAALADSFAHAMKDSGADQDAVAQRSVRRVLGLDWEQHHLAKVRKHEQASVSIRMRVMAEIIAEANLLNPKQYPQIRDNTLTMAVPVLPHDDYARAENEAVEKMCAAFSGKTVPLPDGLSVMRMEHLKNGAFVLFQTNL